MIQSARHHQMFASVSLMEYCFSYGYCEKQLVSTTVNLYFISGSSRYFLPETFCCPTNGGPGGGRLHPPTEDVIRLVGMLDPRIHRCVAPTSVMLNPWLHED